jgi:CubicO group peptidase (beta-lactamase class C family)
MVLLLVGGVTVGDARDFQRTSPERVGMISQRLHRIDLYIDQEIRQNHIAGAVAMVLRQGDLAYFKAFGMQDREAGLPMKTDSIFRIASMSKPLTSLGAMLLYEEGKFLLSDPVSKFIPEFKEMQVMVVDGSHSTLVPAAHPITIRHLLTHTSGLTYRFRGHPYLSDLYKQAGISNGLYPTAGTIGDMVKSLAKLPLFCQPGEQMEYGLNTDVLGYLIEIWSGMPLDRFMKTRVFDPLDMRDTSFYLAPEKRARLAAVYEPDGKGGIRRLPETVIEGQNVTYAATTPYTEPKTYFSGGAGLVSTAEDYAKFCEMILDMGGVFDYDDAQSELKNVYNFLGRKTAELMVKNHIGGLTPTYCPPGYGFGLGFAVHLDPGQSGEIYSEGTLSWSGFFNTQFWIDPKESLVGILMLQNYPAGESDLASKFPVLVYQSIGE